jgi:hypothetical protein
MLWLMTDGQSARQSWNKAPIWSLRPYLYYCQTVAGLLMWGVHSEERTGLLHTIAAGPRHRNHFRVRFLCDSWPYFTVSDSWRPFSSLPTTRRVTVEVLDPLPSTRERSILASTVVRITPLHGSSRTHRFQQYLYFCIRIRCRETVFTEPLPRNGFTCCNIFE